VNRQFFLGVEPGTILFGKYIHERCIFVSDTSAVYLCRSMTTSGAVALKVISSREFENGITGHRLFNESEVSKRVAHQNVVHYDEFHFDPDFAACAMEYLGGGSLGTLLQGWGRLSIHDSLFVLDQLAKGLEAIHYAGIIHRDIKPENILFSTEGIAKISDFGIATIGDRITCGKEEVMLGTINYLSPEYITTGIYDRRSDLYSLGLVAYEMISGRLPDIGRTPMERMMCRAKMDPAELMSVYPDCPAPVSEFVMRAISRDPNKRFQSAQDMLTSLRPILKLFGEELRGEGSFSENPTYRVGSPDLQFPTMN
jgi:serine/threonine-protein kinase